MVICLYGSSKGEVGVGFGGRVCIIVDDSYRNHHVFHFVDIFPDIPLESLSYSEDNSEESVEGWQTQHVTFSLSGTWFGALANDKYIVIWRRVSDPTLGYDTWSIIHKIGPLKKAATTIMLTPDDKYLLIGDKSGNVLGYDFNSLRCDVIFGHVSVILSMASSIRGDVLATGDRDNRIRITNFPLIYQVETFCVGHQSCITQLIFTENFLISGSADGFVKLWDYRTGELLDEVNLATVLEIEKPCVQAIHHHCRDNRILVVIQDSPSIFWFEYAEKGKITKTFNTALPISYKIIASCWDFHGVFWVAIDNPIFPVEMFFLDPELPKVFVVDTEQDHRIKALSKYVFRTSNNRRCDVRLLQPHMNKYLRNPSRSDGKIQSPV